MKRNLLMLLFAMLIGMFTANAQSTVNCRIVIDNPANAVVTVNSPYGDPIELQGGPMGNNVPIPTNSAIFITPQRGATLDVTANYGNYPVNWVENAQYQAYQVRIENSGVMIEITSTGGAAQLLNMSFNINNPGTAFLSFGGDTYALNNGVSFDIPEDEWATITPKEDYEIYDMYFSMSHPTDYYKENTDGSWSFKPYSNSGVSISTRLKGIKFNVATSVRSNVIVNAYDADGNNLGVVDIDNYTSPYLGSAPLNATDLGFTAPEGGKIVSITRIEANGQRTPLGDGNASEGGWRSKFAEGDTFEVTAIGPEVEVAFKGYGTIDGFWAPLTLDAFAVTVAGQPVYFDKGAMDATAKVHVGDVISATTRRGYVLQSPGGLEGADLSIIEGNGATQTAYITGNAAIILNAFPITDKVINIDHAEGVTIKGNFGQGEVLDLKDGENVFDEVPNPLRIVPNDGWMIVSANLDGEALRPQSGVYTATLENGSVLNITTRETDKPFIVTITTRGGDRDGIVVKKNGEVVDPSEILQATNYSSITIAAKPGYIIKEITDAHDNTVSYNPENNTYDIFFLNGASMISVVFEEAENGEMFVGLDCPDKSYCLVVYDKDGKFIPNIMGDGLWYVWAGFTAKVPAGSSVKVATFTGYSCFESITVNGVTTEFDVEDFVRSSELIKLDTERTAISATIAYPEFPILLSGSESLEVVYGSGAVIGTIYINKVGNMKDTAWPGEVVKVYPVPAKGYVFDKFSYSDGEKEIDYDFEIVGPEEDGSYSFTIPMDYVAENIYMRGFFVPDPENPSYLVMGDRVYANTSNEEDDILVGFVAVNGGTDLFAFPGEKITLGFYQDQATLEDYHAEYFCSYATPDTPLAVEPAGNGLDYYTVNPDDAAFSNVIMISVKLGEGPAGQGGINGVVVDGDFNYDAASGILYSAKDVKVYNAAGQLVATFAAGENSLENLPAGVYLLSNGVKTVKIAK